MSTLAEQLAPLSKKPPSPNAWQALLNPKELAAFNSGLYDSVNCDTGAKDLRKAPRESAKISRDKCLDFFEEENEESARGTPTPEELTQAAEFANSFDVIGTISKPCVICGHSQAAHEAKVVMSSTLAYRSGHGAALARMAGGHTFCATPASTR